MAMDIKQTSGITLAEGASPPEYLVFPMTVQVLLGMDGGGEAQRNLASYFF